ncbi:MAG: glutaredoxin domain-containing protein [bacterium]|nr:glutaredoxin domain-containing protein [bacterium]
MYSTPTCPYCERAKELLNNVGLVYEDVDVETNPQERVNLIKKYNWMTTPAIFIDGELIGGYDELSKLNAEGKLVEAE